jgi:hypothetical protein
MYFCSISLTVQTHFDVFGTECAKTPGFMPLSFRQSCCVKEVIHSDVFEMFDSSSVSLLAFDE